MVLDTPAKSRIRAAFSQPVYRLLLASFLIAALVPMGLLSVHLYHVAWEKTWREVAEKHQLLATNLTSPIHIYINDHQNLLAVLADGMVTLSEADAQEQAYQKPLQHVLDNVPGFSALVVLDNTGTGVAFAQRGEVQVVDVHAYVDHACVRGSLQGAEAGLCDVRISPLNHSLVLQMTQSLRDASGHIIGVLLGELSLVQIEVLRQGIQFGEKGHCAIVGADGHVVAHPNAQWVAQRRDLSAWPIVQALMQGKTGVSEFYSPHAKAHMLAGYATVPDIGWGVMVQQPKSEVTDQVRSLLFSYFLWAGMGLLLALGLAVALVRWITHPLRVLARQAGALEKNGFEGALDVLPQGAPQEVRQLNAALSVLVTGLQRSRREVQKLNEMLQLRVDEATQQLREANTRLQRLANRDYLTALSNRRHFETMLSSNLQRRSADAAPACLMLIDIDKFKTTNDRFGHAGGDAVLKQVAALLEKAMRPNDLAARYGGDEFVAYIHCPAQAAFGRAQQIRLAIESSQIMSQGRPIGVTVSIGLLVFEQGSVSDIEPVLRKVDAAMYEAKRGGRNQVFEVR